MKRNPRQIRLDSNSFSHSSALADKRCRRLRPVLLLATALIAMHTARSAVDHVVRFDAKAGAHFAFADHIDFPAYSWPRTLLSNLVDFTGVEIDPDDLVLVNRQTDQAVPFQLSDMVFADERLVRATVNFFSDLPSGAERRFVLQRRTADTRPTEPLPAPVAISRNNDLIEINNGHIGIAIPANRQESPRGIVGPLAGMTRGERNLGSSHLRTGERTVTGVESDILESGPLFAVVGIRYHFDNGGAYRVRVKVIAGYEHLEFEETIEGLSEADGVSLEMGFEGFDPQYRFAAGNRRGTFFSSGRRIDEPFVSVGELEDPRWTPGWREVPSEEMVMRLLPYQGNLVRESAPCVSFWEADEQSGGNLELGLFALDHQKWQDHQYKVWQHSTKLQVTFRYTDNVLFWMWPLATGTRSTALSVTEPEAGQAQVQELRDIYASNGFNVERWRSPRYVQLMHQRYGALSLNRVKNWGLRYPEHARQPANIFSADLVRKRRADEYERGLFQSVLVQYPFGINVAPGGTSIDHRFVFKDVVPEYTQLVTSFTSEQKKRIDALLLLTGYVTTGEEMHPIRTAVAGCPNMAADGWAVPAQMAFLFPEHPMAGEWLDYYERTWDITHRKYTRPDVDTYESFGGRWTESLATYNWAHLRPTGHSQIAGILTDGKNRWATPEAALRGRWMVDLLTAPVFNPNPEWRYNFRQGQPRPPDPLDPAWQAGDPFSSDQGFTRQYPAQGAHSTGTARVVPEIVELYGRFMHHYDPLLAEHILWAAHQGKSRGNLFESRSRDLWMEKMFELYPENAGTNPHLRSVKYTGHGIVLRAGVDTPEELSIHLNQVDRGPNYRWGLGGENSSGSLYFFANGRPYTGHERQNAGDRRLDATDGVTTFGVMKDGSYRSIGMNVLEKPLYDLGVAQFAEVTSREGESAYSWPGYQSRSIMLVGTDYWMLGDRFGGGARFTWFTVRDLDFPKLIFLNPEHIRQDHWTEIQTPMSKGFHRDFHGSFLHTVLVTHRDEVGPVHMAPQDLPFLTSTPVKQYRRGRGFDTPDGAWRIQTGHSQDIVFRSLEPIDYRNEEGDLFEGTAGVIRRQQDGALEMAMFHSRKIGMAGLTVAVDREDIGVGCRLENGRVEGVFKAPEGGQLTLTTTDIADKTVYIDSLPAVAVKDNTSLTVELPAGRHTWQLVAGPARPAQPVIQRTEHLKEGVKLVFSEAAGARDYSVEISRDGGNSWEEVTTTAETSIILPELSEGKYHVRTTGRNGELHSHPAYEWPIYVTGEAPPPPEGVTVRITEDGAELSWGRVLGVTEYRLYRRRAGTDDYEMVYSGGAREFTDSPPRPLTKPYALPGRERNAGKPAVAVYEYAVSGVNGFGEGDKSHPVSTDPANWLVWKPAGPLGFSRRSAFWEPPYVPAHMMPPENYPGPD